MRLRKLVALLTIPIVLMLFHNRVANWHFHVLNNGIVVEHAHPFTASQTAESPYQSHSHSSWEMFIYEVVTSISVLVILAILSLAKFSFDSTPKATNTTQGYTPIALHALNTYRGPPSF